MKKLLFLSIFGILFAQDLSFSRNVLSLKVPAQEDFTTIKIPAMDLKIGESGIISREVNGNEFIIAEAQVEAINEGVAVVRVSDFTRMREKYLPKPQGKVAEGDKITFRILYDKALLIAPNQSVYQAIVAQFGDIDFLHSDIFATYLAKEGENMPSVADFGKFCAKFDIGLVFIALENALEVLNCQSFKILDSTPLSLGDNSVIAPFFTRISKESIDDMFNIKKFQPYFEYFENLIKSQNGGDSRESADLSLKDESAGLRPNPHLLLRCKSKQKDCNSRKSQDFFAYFFSKKVSGRQPKLKNKLPPLFGRGQGGVVNV